MSRLGDAPTPYLATGAEQGIDWWPHDDAAFAEAERLRRPLLVVVGASFSHACHVLDREAFGEPVLAASIAGRTIPVRVDRDARPDLDARYQRLVGATGGVWPVVALLTPSGEPFFAATHLRAVDLATLVEGLGGSFDHDRARVLERVIATRLAAQRLVARTVVARGPGAEDVAQATQRILAAGSPRLGGFGAPPKFPHAPTLALLLAGTDPAGRTLALHTLDLLAEGGIHDQLVGGFHRYSTDERWVVPHFEKRAVDQGALLLTYAQAYGLTREPRYLETARATIDYVEAELADPGGGFRVAQDCDAGIWDDGRYYTWTLDEAAGELSPEELAVLQPRYDLYGRGEMHVDPTRNVLFVAASVAAITRETGKPAAEVQRLIAAGRAKLRAARALRASPAVDPTLYVGVSAALARAYLAAARDVDDPRLVPRALGTLERLYGELERAGTEGGLGHQVGGDPGGRALEWLPDLAELGLAALAAFERTGDPAHREAAAAMAGRLVERFWDPEGLRDRPRELAERLPFEPVLHPVRDGAGASANALGLALLDGVARLTGDADGRARVAGLVATLWPAALAEGVRGAGLVSVALGRDGSDRPDPG